jgi:general stress protein 26
MDSINKNQPEKNHEDLSSAGAVSKIKELVDKANSCFFCTKPTDESIGTRPMSVQKIDDAGALWFLSPNDSHKNADINADSDVKLYFRGSAHSDFLYLEGKASISTDKAVIKELWEPLLKTWFTEGEDDPRISAIKVIPTSGYYWDTKHGNAVAFMKTVVGAMTGKTLDDSIEGNLKV